MKHLSAAILCLLMPALGTTVATAQDQVLTIESDGQSYSYRHVEAEPLSFLPDGAGLEQFQPALRISGAQDFNAANRVMGLICGIDADEAADYGAYGDPVLQDAATGEWVYWLDCRPETRVAD